MIRARNLFLALSLALVAKAAGNALGEEPQEPASNEEQIEAPKPSADEPLEREELGIPPDVPEGPAEVYGGNLWSRNTLTGDWFGYRNRLSKKGITFHSDLTLVEQGVTSGGLDTGFEFGGIYELKTTLDFEKLGFWPGAFVDFKVEGKFADSVISNAGNLVPVNMNHTHPVTREFDDDEIAITNLVFTQFLSERFGVYVGKVDTLDGDQNEFASGRGKTQFMNTALVLNPLTTLSVPYSALAAGAIFLPNEHTQVSVTVIDTEESSTTTGFDSVFDEGTTIAAEAYMSHEVFELPGRQMFGFTWSNQRFIKLNQSLGNIITGNLAEKSKTVSVTYNAHQYLYAEKDDPSQGFGIFGRAGFSDGEPNPLDWSLSGGIGGKGIIPGRDNDTFGLGYYYISISNELPAIFSLDDEQGFEIFYNVEVTPWFHLTPDLQIIDPSPKSSDTAVVLALRTVITF